LGAVKLELNKIDKGFHVQAQIGDSVVVLSAMERAYEEAIRASIYLYVDDLDTTYEREPRTLYRLNTNVRTSGRQQ